MNSTKKLVNIYPSRPITDFNPPIRIATKRIYKTIPEIRTCLLRDAIVEEILEDGVIRLGLNNYDQDNSKPVEEELILNNVAPETTNEDPIKALWNAAYNEFLADKDLSSLTKRQRKAIQAEARAAADAAVAILNETTEEVENEEPTVENETVEEEVVVTEDAEDVSEITE